MRLKLLFHIKGVKTKVVLVETRTKGTMILRCGGCFYKVLKLRSSGDNNYIFECKDLDTKESKILQYRMSSLLEALDRYPICAFLKECFSGRRRISMSKKSSKFLRTLNIIDAFIVLS